MKKTVAFLLCFCMILPLSACFRIDQPSDKIDAPVFDLDTTEGLDFIASPDAEKNEPAEKPQENTETPSQSFQNETRYYKTEDVGNGKTKYTVYNLGETEVFSGETDKPIAITMLSNFVIKICIGQNICFQVFTKNTRKSKRTDNADQRYRCNCTCSNLK